MAAVIAAKLEEIKTTSKDAQQFLMLRTVVKCPTCHTDTMVALAKTPGGDKVQFLDAHNFYLLMQASELHKKPEAGK